MMNTNFILKKHKKILLIENSKIVHHLISTVNINKIRSSMNSKIKVFKMIILIINKSSHIKMIRIMKLLQIKWLEKTKVRLSKKNKLKNINIKNQFLISNKILMKILIVSSIDFFPIVQFSKKLMIKTR